MNGMKFNKDLYNLESKIIILLNKWDELEEDKITHEYYHINNFITSFVYVLDLFLQAIYL